MATRLEILRELTRLDDQYEEIIGHNAYLYAKSVDGKSVFVFTEHRVMDTPENALAHMKALMAQLAADLSGGQ